MDEPRKCTHLWVGDRVQVITDDCQVRKGVIATVARVSDDGGILLALMGNRIGAVWSTDVERI